MEREGMRFANGKRHASAANGSAANGTGMTKNKSDGGGKSAAAAGSRVAMVSYTSGWSVVPPLLLLLCPAFVMLMSYTIVELDGFTGLVEKVKADGPLAVLQQAWLPYLFGSTFAWKIILPYAVLQLFLMKALPGKLTKGPVTPAGNVPVYKANGLLTYFATLAIFIAAGFVFKLFNPADIYDHYLEFIGAMNLVSLTFCLGLYLKGMYFPSSTDSGSSSNFLFDYFWGTELYPRVFGWDVKMFTNCRFGMMAWPLLILCYATKQYESESGLSDSMVVAVALQLVYITKFFHWEMGYMKTLDIMHDRAGFYLCWGCLVWVPSIYTSHTLYLTTHPNHLGTPLTLFILVVGVLAIFLNYDADRHKELTRKTQGNCTIWGRKPTTIQATYHTTTGEEKNSLLLVSGWWGVSRHFHYIPEILAAFCWTVPALFCSALPYFYFVFLTILLGHRAVRDDQRCLEKYGRFWRIYCKAVPYKILPFIF